MKFLVCPDSFKDSMRSTVVCAQIINAITTVIPQAIAVGIPLSDGGQGFLDAIATALPATSVTCQVTGALVNNQVEAKYLLIDNNETAIFELATVAGLELLASDQRNPLFTTTYGMGELILHAINHYPLKKIIIGLGGSATNDGGVGMLQALGVKFTNINNHEIGFGGRALAEIKHIDLSGIDKRIFELSIEIACDVTNPLLGVNGATYVYGRQKGADTAAIYELENALTNYSQVLFKLTAQDYSNYPGAGAAGGTATGLLLLNGKITPGAEVIARYTELEKQISIADYVISGEGSVDEQTLYGKTINRIAQLCTKYDKPLLIFCGRSSGRIDYLYQNGVTAIFPISNGADDLSNSLLKGRENLYNCVINVCRLLHQVYNKRLTLVNLK
ncbi:glycerate kinase [Aquella oligotrophica]|uniref:Glycerate kinase n=1 Tax=Aquella oligotrophica TaxID=2067065 RepID=A0A2I7N770_9NEIS|nr:glycerate kinase [Aquella oligotrophica]AUR52302.1 glycerate kinase [Aquella oligotrophica]